MNLLYGFSDIEVQKRIEKAMKDRGFGVDGVCVCGKVHILSYLEQHPEIDTCVFTEVMSDGSSFEASDLTKITDEKEVNIIIVLDSERKGSEYVRQLYAGGILGGLFVDSSGCGVSVPDIVDLILEPRNRKVARSYYGIGGNEIVDSDKVSGEKIQEYIRFLSNEGDYSGIGERYIRVVTSLTRNQNVDFFGRLPAPLREAILATPEYVRAKAAIESTSPQVIVSMSSSVGNGKEKRRKGTELKKLEDVAVAQKELPALAEVDLDEYVENILRPFMESRKPVLSSEHVPVAEDILHQMRYDMARATGRVYQIPEKKKDSDVRKFPLKEQSEPVEKRDEASSAPQVKKIFATRTTEANENAPGQSKGSVVKQIYRRNGDN